MCATYMHCVDECVIYVYLRIVHYNYLHECVVCVHMLMHAHSSL